MGTKDPYHAPECNCGRCLADGAYQHSRAAEYAAENKEYEAKLVAYGKRDERRDVRLCVYTLGFWLLLPVLAFAVYVVHSFAEDLRALRAKEYTDRTAAYEEGKREVLARLLQAFRQSDLQYQGACAKERDAAK